MYFIDSYFYPKRNSRTDCEFLEDAVRNFIITLLKNGNAVGDYLFEHVNDSIRVTTMALERNSFDKKYWNKWIKQNFKKILKYSEKEPQFLVDNMKVKKVAIPNIKESSFYFLYTDIFSKESPIRCGKTGKGIPMYRLPINQKIREQVFFWQEQHHSLESIWFHSSYLEKETCFELSSAKSVFSQWGRSLCQEIQQVTAKPVYYALNLERYEVLKTENKQRKCPECGKLCKSIIRQERKKLVHWFDSRCDSCLLLLSTH